MTLIVSTFPGCGKTYLVNKFNGRYCNYSMVDKDNGFLSCYNDYNVYANEISMLIGKVDIVFVSQYPECLQILHSKGYRYIIVAPNNLNLMSKKLRNLNKQQWFGRFTLRHNSSRWLKLLEENYEKWTSLEHLQSMHPSQIILLNYNEYLVDIIDDIIALMNTMYN